VSESRLVYSTDGGDRRGRAPQKAAAPTQPRSDGIVRVSREKTGRGGKVVTVIRGLPGDAAELRRLAGELKRRCGAGGGVQGDAVEIQGDHRDTVAAHLTGLGLRVKLAGG
jgi:translation initiation factor 1